MKIIAHIFRLAIIMFFMYDHSYAQISPGPLAQDHAHLEGISNCTKCHSIGNAVTNAKCLDCHKEIQSLITQKRGFHATTSTKAKKCVECHNDHHGRKFDMVRFDEKKFDHTTAGYKLEGAHATTDCRECHKSSNIKDVNLKKRKETFLGLSKECRSCHTDYHQGTLDANCAKCHDVKKFSPAPLFSHAKSKFPLKGAHAKVACIDCHQKSVKNGNDFQMFKGVPFGKCTDCHKDVHNGKFGNNCLKCHNENSFKQLNKTNEFNHNLTNYPLTGMHARVDCKACHKGKTYAMSVNTTLCRNCHTDYHKGDFVKNGIQTDCVECHSLENPFSQTSYNLTRHQKTNFPLEGAHVATSCVECHKKNEKWNFKNVGKTCTDCHQDNHAGLINASYYLPSNCKECHTVNAWAEVSFDHNRTKWALKGKHEKTDCRSCHFSKDKIPGKPSTQKFAGLSNACSACHQNVHGDQFAINKVTDCNRCHKVADSWNVENFDHSKTQFPLDGKHARVECKACHKKVEVVDEKPIRIYKLASFRCIDCHS